MKRFRLERLINGKPFVQCLGVQCIPGGPVLVYWLSTESCGFYPNIETFRATHINGSVYQQEVIWVDE